MSTSAAVSEGQLFIPVGQLADALRTAATGNTQTHQLEDILRVFIAGSRFDHAAITMVHSERTFQTIVSTSELAGKLDQLQYDVGDGPAPTTAGGPGVVTFDGALSNQPWPAWASLAAEAGIASALSVHLLTDTGHGSLSLYSEQSGPFSEEDLLSASIVGTHVSALLTFARTTENLRRAIDARNLIGQAQGVLMERHRLTADQAFAVLSHYSQHHNIKVSLLAEELTLTGILPDLERSLSAAH